MLWRSDVSLVLVRFFLGWGHLSHSSRRAHEVAPAWSHHCNPVERKNSKPDIKNTFLYKCECVVCASHLTCFYKKNWSSWMYILQKPVSKQLSFKCIARAPEHWQGIINMLPESLADFKQKTRIKTEICFRLFFRCGGQETFLHTYWQKGTIGHALQNLVQNEGTWGRKIERWLINFVWHQLSVHCCERIIPLSAFIKSWQGPESQGRLQSG